MTTLILDGAVIAEMLRGSQGVVMRDLTDRATRVQLAARSQVKSTTKGSGRLAAGIVKRPARHGVNPVIMVGVWNVPYAIYVHDGTEPHIIRPRTKKALAFFMGHGGTTHDVNGRTVDTVVRFVNHPGTKANRFLSDNLHLAG